MTTTVYRFSTSTALPLHWSYLDAFDDDGKDNRQAGFQVWTDLVALRTAQRHHDDGDFSAAAYPLFSRSPSLVNCPTAAASGSPSAPSR